MQRTPDASSLSAQGYVDDPRNERVLVYVNGAFVPRDAATVSVFDAGFVLGDGIWEGLRLVRGKLISLDAHLDRLFEGARAIRLDLGRTPITLRSDAVQLPPQIIRHCSARSMPP